MMKKQILKPIAVFFVLAIVASSFTSCNKGYGCPSNFKADKISAKAVTTVAKAAVKAVVN